MIDAHSGSSSTAVPMIAVISRDPQQRLRVGDRLEVGAGEHRVGRVGVEHHAGDAGRLVDRRGLDVAEGRVDGADEDDLARRSSSSAPCRRSRRRRRSPSPCRRGLGEKLSSIDFGAVGRARSGRRSARRSGARCTGSASTPRYVITAASESAGTNWLSSGIDTTSGTLRLTPSLGSLLRCTCPAVARRLRDPRRDRGLQLGRRCTTPSAGRLDRRLSVARITLPASVDRVRATPRRRPVVRRRCGR